MDQKEKVTEEKLYKVIRKKGNHQNTKVNEDSSRVALQFTKNNNMDGSLDIIEATDDEVIWRGKELSREGRTWKQIVWEEIIVPISKEATEQLLRIGHQHFEVWMEETAVPVAKEKSKMFVQNVGDIFSGVKAVLKGEEPKALRLIKEAQEFREKEHLSVECDSIPEKKIEDDGNSEKILMSAQEIEEVVAQAKQSAEILVCRIQKFNMKCEIERMEIIYTFYFFFLLEKSD